MRRNDMSGTEKMVFAMRALRSVAVLAIFLLALASPAGPMMADEGCWDYVLDCTSVEECVEHLEEPCYQPGECEGEVHCYPASEYTDCYYSQEEATMLCRLIENP
jgi:hypothetical protein